VASRLGQLRALHGHVIGSQPRRLLAPSTYGDRAGAPTAHQMLVKTCLTTRLLQFGAYVSAIWRSSIGRPRHMISSGEPAFELKVSAVDQSLLLMLIADLIREIRLRSLAVDECPV
jgi:hypothetical protein